MHQDLSDEVFHAFYVDHGDRECFISFHLRAPCRVAEGFPLQPCYARTDSGGSCGLPEGHEVTE